MQPTFLIVSCWILTLLILISVNGSLIGIPPEWPQCSYGAITNSTAYHIQYSTFTSSLVTHSLSIGRFTLFVSEFTTGHSRPAWEQAWAYCQEVGIPHLGAPESQAELNQVVNAIESDIIASIVCGADRDIWIGIERPGQTASDLWHYSKNRSQDLYWPTSDSEWLFDVSLENGRTVGAMGYVSGLDEWSFTGMDACWTRPCFLCDGLYTPQIPSLAPTDNPTSNPTSTPSSVPSDNPTMSPSQSPTMNPSQAPTVVPTTQPTKNPTESPTATPSQHPSLSPSDAPSMLPSLSLSLNPTSYPSTMPSMVPSQSPSNEPTPLPTKSPTFSPSRTNIEIQIVSTIFTDDASAIVIQFNQKIQLNNQYQTISSTDLCYNLFADTDESNFYQNKLGGESIQCLFGNDNFQIGNRIYNEKYLIIILSIESNVNINDQFNIYPSFYLTGIGNDDSTKFTFSQITYLIQIESPLTAFAPQSIINGNNQIGACDDLLLNGLSSVWTGPQLLTFEWTCDQINNNDLSQYIITNNNGDATNIVIPASDTTSGIIYHFQLKVVSFFNTTDIVTFDVSVDDAPLPIVTLQAPLEWTSNRDLQIQANVQIGLNDQCLIALGLQPSQKDELIPLTYQWILIIK